MRSMPPLRAATAMVLGVVLSLATAAADAPPSDAERVQLDRPPRASWTQLIGGVDLDSGYGTTAAADGGVFVVGATQSPRVRGLENAGVSDILLAKLAPNGKLLWLRLLGGENRDTGFAVAAAPDGGVALVGLTTSVEFAGQIGTGVTDAVLARYDADGRLLWVRLLATRGIELGSGVAFDDDGSIVIVGSIGSRPLKGRTSEPAISEAEPDGLRDLSETEARIGPPRRFAFVARYSPEGERLFFRRYGGPSAQTIARDVAIGADGSIYVAGDTYEPELDGQQNGGAVDAVLVKFDARGRHQWTRLWGFESEDEARGVAIDEAGFVYIAGSVENWGRLCTHLGCTRVRLNPDMLLAKYNPNGGRVWTRVLRGLQWDFLQDIAVGPGNRVYAMGWTNSARLEHQPTSVDGNGDRAIMVGAYDTNGNGKWLFFAAEGNGFGVAVSKRGDLYGVGSASGGFLGQKSAGSGDIAVVKFSARALSAAGGDRP